MVSQPKNYYANVFSFHLVAKIEKPHPGKSRDGVDCIGLTVVFTGIQ